MTDQTSSPPKRKRGAPLGNTNAVTHGFYSRQFRTADLDDVQDCSVASLKDEIDMLRVHIRRLIQLGEDIDDYDKFANLLRILCLASTSLNRLIRTQHIITPKGDDALSILINQALSEVTEELGVHRPTCK